MSTKDEKDWLRAILEGKVKPGDAEWKRIWQEEDFTGVRRVLREVGMRKKDELVADREKMWRVVKQYRGEGINRRRVPVWRWVAAAMLPLLLGGILWINSREKKDVLVAGVVPEIEAGTPRAVLFMEQGERIDLSLLAGDTILNKGDVRIRLDSSKSVTYERVTGTPAKIEYNTIIVPRKGEYQLILADGSKVYLNSESRLRFPTRFEGEERRVYLEGEGYFEVVKDSVRPFFVNADKLKIRVYGTSFNVNTYDLENIQTVLVEGKIGIQTMNMNTEYMVKPGQLALYNQEKGTMEILNVDVLPYVAWKDHEFMFDDESLEKIMNRLSLWYDVDVFFQTASLKQLHFTGHLGRYDDISHILDAISGVTQVKFSVKGRTIIVME